ncbi:MAG: FkbM family methyltransferase, partial [Kofleriaceae bacterium]|nr:FkbM family methyltransferase [Kofleriaceae bacterium]
GGEVFVDIGGFDGSTSIEFIRRCPDYAGVYLFEPEPTNASKARAILRNCEKVQVFELGLGDTQGEIRFSADGSTSGMNSSGGITVQIDTLDNILNDTANHDISFIKMDIEGAESMAIEGATQTILRHHPKLAICVYHKLADMRTIPEQILRIRDDYDIYLRHYTEGVVETVMFFVPR